MQEISQCLKAAILIAALAVNPTAGADVAAGSCQYGEVNELAPTETDQFAFLVGHHEVTLHAWTGAGWSPPRAVNARWHGWYGLDGMAIYDEWSDPDPTSGGMGINVRIYDPQEKLWKMMWVSTTGMQVQDLRAETRAGVLTMWQVHPERSDWKAEFEVTDHRNWARVSYVKDESGRWQPQFRLAATQVSCSDR